MLHIDEKDKECYDSPEGDLLTLQDVCELLRVNKAYVYSLTHMKRIPYIKMQGHLRFRRGDIDDWLSRQEVRSANT